jgi:hypothetical protein
MQIVVPALTKGIAKTNNSEMPIYKALFFGTILVTASSSQNSQSHQPP